MAKKRNFMDDLGDFIGKGAQSIRDRLKMDVTDLIRAVQKNDVEGVERALRAGLDPNVPDGINRMALPMAVDNNKTEIVLLLLKKGKAIPDVIDQNGQSALYKAVSWENHEIVQLLTDAGADANKISPADGATPLKLAQEKNYTEVLQILAKTKKVAVDKAIKKRAEEDAATKAAKEEQLEATHKREDDLARHQALKAKAKRAKLEKELTQKEALLKEIVAKRKKKAVEQARVDDSLEGKYGVKDNHYLPALLQAIKNKDNEATRNFIPKVKDINAFDETHQTTVLMLAVKNKIGKLADFLIGKGANAFLALPTSGETPLSKAIATHQDGIVRKLIETNPEALKAYATDKNQKESYLYNSIQHPKMFDALLEAGADIHFGGTEKMSPFLEAIHSGPLSILPVLKQNEIDLNAVIDGKTPLDWAIESGMQSWLIGLLKEGANPDTVDGDSKTPLMRAVEVNNPAMVEILLEDKADPTIRNKEGKTALEIAKALGDREDIVKILRD